MVKGYEDMITQYIQSLEKSIDKLELKVWEYQSKGDYVEVGILLNKIREIQNVIDDYMS